MKKRVVAIVMAVVFLITMTLSGCGAASKEDTSESKATEGSKVTQSTTAEKQSTEEISASLRILWPGTSDIEKEVAGDLEKAVKEKYPKIAMEFMYLVWGDLNKKLAVMVQSKDYPDLVEVLGVSDFVAMDALEPLDSYFGGNLKLDMFSKAPLQIMSVDGKIYGVPGISDIYGHVVNTKLLAEAGFKPEDITSWDTLKQAVKAMTKDGKYGYAMADGANGRYCFRDLMMACISNGTRADDITDASKQKYIEVLQLFKDMAPYMPKSQVTWTYPELYKAWEAEDIGMIHSGIWFTANIISHGTNSIKDTSAIVFPKGPSADAPAAMTGTAGFSIIKGSNQKEAAWKVIETMFTIPILGKWSVALAVPCVNYIDSATIESAAQKVYPEVYKDHLRLINDFMKIDKVSIPEPQLIAREPMEKVVQGAVVKMLDGKLTAEQAYGEIKKGIEQVRASAN
jgi:ABC-type sugar transport system, periplasmic component